MVGREQGWAGIQHGIRPVGPTSPPLLRARQRVQRPELSRLCIASSGTLATVTHGRAATSGTSATAAAAAAANEACAAACAAAAARGLPGRCMACAASSILAGGRGGGGWGSACPNANHTLPCTC